MNNNITSPRTDDVGIEQEIQAKGLAAPRVTRADLDANIVQTEIVKHVSPSGQILRWAVLTTRSGFAVTGRPSASVSCENDNAEIGEKIAIDNAKSELWPLMGYELRSRLASNEVATEANPIALTYDVDADLLRMAANPHEFVLDEIDPNSLGAALENVLADPAMKGVRLQVIGLSALDVGSTGLA